jgi:hypothetical protein
VAQSKITAGDGAHLATGKITITASVAFLAADGTWVETTPLIVPVINGAFSVQLEPGNYAAKWQLDGAAPRTDYWLVVTSSSALNLAAVRVSVPPTVSTMFAPSQISAAGMADGTYCLNVVSKVVVGLAACSSGGSSSLSLSTLTNGQLLALTNSQLSGLGN